MLLNVKVFPTEISEGFFLFFFLYFSFHCCRSSMPRQTKLEMALFSPLSLQFFFLFNSTSFLICLFSFVWVCVQKMKQNCLRQCKIKTRNTNDCSAKPHSNSVEKMLIEWEWRGDDSRFSEQKKWSPMSFGLIPNVWISFSLSLSHTLSRSQYHLSLLNINPSSKRNGEWECRACSK